MRVVDTKDFCIPSDENDYDELVAFADTMASIPQFDAVPMSVIKDIKAEIKSLMKEQETHFDVLEVGANRAFLRTLSIIDRHVKGGE